MQKTTLLLAVALAFSASSWGQDVKINGTGVSLEANKTPIHTAKNPQAIALLPQDLHLAVPGKFTVAVAALNSPPLTVFADDNKTLLGSEADIARLVAESLGLEVNVVPTSWEDWPLGVTSGKYDAAQTLALQTGRADAFFGPNVIGAWKAALTGKTKLVGSVDGGWPKAAHIAVTLKKDSGLVNAVQAALNGAIASGDYAKVLNRWGEGVESIPQSEINPPGLGD